MIVRFTGLENSLNISKGCPAVLEVQNRALFSRLCRSLQSCKGEEAIEPFSLWSDGGDEMRASNSYLFIESPLALPWDDRALANGLQSGFDRMLLESDSCRSEIEQLLANLQSAVARLGFQMEADYGFALEWELRQYLKAFRFGVKYDPDDALIDNLIQFLDYASDVAVGKLLVFVGLKNFLTEKDVTRLYERVFYHEMNVLLLESAEDQNEYQHERKLVIDQHFLESFQ